MNYLSKLRENTRSVLCLKLFKMKRCGVRKKIVLGPTRFKVKYLNLTR